MARLLFGGDDVSMRGPYGSAQLNASGRTGIVYADATTSALADIVTYPGGAAIAGSVITVTSDSQLPLFQGPADGSDTVWVSVDGGTRTPIYTNVDARLDLLATSVGTKAATTYVDAQDAATLSSAQTFATGAVGTETSRAMTAEATKLVAGSTATYANLAALPAASAHTNEIHKTLDGGVYESTGSAWVQLVAPNGTYAFGLTSTAVKTSAYAAAAGDLVPVDTTAGNVAVTLPTSPADNARVAVKHVVQGGTNTVSVTCGGSDVFNKAGGSTTLTLTLVNQAVSLQYKASTAVWYVVGDDLPLGGLDGRYLALAGGVDTLGRSYQIKWVVNPATAHSGAHGLWLERSTASSGIITLTLAEAGNPVWDAVALDTSTTDIVLAYSHTTQTDQLRGSVQSKWLLANSAGHPLDESRLQIVVQSNENTNNGLTEALFLSTASDSGVNYAIKWQIIGQSPTSLLGGIRFDGRAAFGALFSTYLTNGYVEAKGGVTAWMPSADPIFQLYRQTDIDKKYRLGIDSSGNFYIEDTTRGVKPFTISSATGTVSIGDGIVIPSATSRVRATADQSVIDDGGGVVGVALINDPELTLPVVVNGIYLIRAFIRYEASQTGDFKCGFLVPAGATIVWSAGGAANSLVGSTGNVNTVSPSGSTSQTYGGNGAGNAFGIRIDGTLVVGATAGNCVFRFAQGAADAVVATKRLANSFLSLERIG